MQVSHKNGKVTCKVLYRGEWFEQESFAIPNCIVGLANQVAERFGNMIAKYFVLEHRSKVA